MLRITKSVLVRFDSDEKGMEAVQIIMTLAIAAMVCVGVARVSGVTGGSADGGGILGWITDTAKEFIGEKISGWLKK